MDLRVLESFLAIAREESITAAANSLHISQPALSRQMKELEKELGKKLIIRESRGISLTEDGQFFRRRAEEMIALMEKTRSELAGSDGAVSGDVYIGAGEAESVHYLTEAAYRLKLAHPNVHFHISSGNTADVLERLNKGLIDFALIVSLSEMDERKYSVIHLPAEEVWGILLPEHHPLAEKDVLTAEDICAQPLIVSNEMLRSDLLTDFTGKAMDELNITATYSLLYNASIMVRDHLGIAVGLDRIINTSGNSDLVFRPLSPKKTSGMCIAWKRCPVFSKAASAYLAELQNAAVSD